MSNLEPSRIPVDAVTAMSVGSHPQKAATGSSPSMIDCVAYEDYIKLGKQFVDKIGFSGTGRHVNVTFIVGPRKEVFYVRKVILFLGNNPSDVMVYDSGVGEIGPLAFPQLNPEAFRKMVQYVETNKLDVAGSTLTQIFDILQVSNMFHGKWLNELCRRSLRRQVNKNNVVEMFNLATERMDASMYEFMRDNIAKNIMDVFLSPQFLQISVDALLSLLKFDDWCLAEIDVFEHVKRWAYAKLDRQNGRQLDGKCLKTAMGEAFYGIRFPLMTRDEFLLYAHGKHKGMFTRWEIKEVVDYMNTGDENVLNMFLARARRRQDVSVHEEASAATQEVIAMRSRRDFVTNIHNRPWDLIGQSFHKM